MVLTDELLFSYSESVGRHSALSRHVQYLVMSYDLNRLNLHQSRVPDSVVFSRLSFEILLEELEDGVLGSSSFLPKRVLFNPSLERRIGFCGVSRPILTSSAIIALSSLV